MVDAHVTAARPWRRAQHLSSVPYLPGLDGMRALAVVAVMIYHANSDWLSGGFLGVEVFFVISGYLITLLLMAERERSGRIDLADFWIRRARRLLPALFVMLFLLLAYTAFFKDDVLGKLRGDLIAALAYVSNWYQIWVGQGYTAAGDFAPLRHLWSLAVEEQFYLLWPIVMLLLLRGGTRKLANTALILFGAAVVVNVAIAVLYHGGRAGTCEATPEAFWQVGERCISKADALYLSTITRSGGLLLGAAFAMVWRPVAIMRSPLRHASRALDLVGLLGLVLLGFLFWRLHFITPDGADPWLFRGGFFVTGIATLLVIASVTHRYALAGKLIGNPVFKYLGTRSYGLYLYHWPIYQIIRKVAGNPLSITQFVVAMAITLVLTELSYTYIETPIRRREVAIWWDSLRRRRDPVPRQMVALGTVLVLAVTAFGVIRLGVADVQANDIEQSLDAADGATVDPNDLLPGGTDTGTTAPPPGTTLPPDSSVAGVPGADMTTTTSTTTTTTTTLPEEPIAFLAIGDSVMKGAAPEMSARGYTVVAEVGTQLGDMVDFVEQLGSAGLIADPIVIHLGTNGPIEQATLDALLAPLGNIPNVVMLNVFAQRSWTAANNAMLAEADKRPNVALIDWNALAPACPGKCFYDDGIHLTPEGQRYYANLIGNYTGK